VPHKSLLPDDVKSSAVELFGIRLSRLGIADALDAISDVCDRGGGGYVCFVNVHTLTESTSDLTLRKALRAATYCFADGMPLVWLSQLKGCALPERIAGPDFTAALLRRERSRCHGFIGGPPGCAEQLADAFALDAITYSPPMRPYSHEHALEDWHAFLARCPGGVPPQLVWLGLGAPKQEQWLHTISPRAPGVTFLGVGAAFEFLAGARPRAPLWLQRTGLEWAHRLATDPRRLWKRYLVSNTRFIALSCVELLLRGSDS
jgi:N-acetylglucosaminyldiphosphoundecaprenol N-acetyl-beta-D-mannosaminyltransferase